MLLNFFHKIYCVRERLGSFLNSMICSTWVFTREWCAVCMCVCVLVCMLCCVYVCWCVCCAVFMCVGVYVCWCVCVGECVMLCFCNCVWMCARASVSHSHDDRRFLQKLLDLPNHHQRHYNFTIFMFTVHVHIQCWMLIACYFPLEHFQKLFVKVIF